MMKELSKSIFRRQRDPNFVTRYFKGTGIDIGGFPDPLSLYTEFFPLIESVRIWDLMDGDAELMHLVGDDEFDFVVSSHCLEHLQDPYIGLKNWFRILKPEGHLVVTIPEEDLYEQGTWPSNKNLDHKWSFTVWKENSWAPRSVNILTLLQSLGEKADIRSIRVEDSGYRYSVPSFDQTLTPTAESAIEFIIRKKTSEEVIKKASACANPGEIKNELLPYFHQYLDDMDALKTMSKEFKPFQKSDPLPEVSGWREEE
jgi:SAM-dependent methyltransferase